MLTKQCFSQLTKQFGRMGYYQWVDLSLYYSTLTMYDVLTNDVIISPKTEVKKLNFWSDVTRKDVLYLAPVGQRSLC